MEPENAVASEVTFDGNVSCTQCGRIDETLLLSLHPYAFSTLVECEERIDAGVFCDSCRAKASAVAVAKSLLLGWWSLAGPGMTVRAIRKNLDGGVYDKADNAEMHRAIARAREWDGDFDRAVAHGTVAQSLKADTEYGRELYALRKRCNFKGEIRKPSHSRLAWLPIAVATVFVLAIGGLFMMRSGDESPDDGSPVAMTELPDRDEKAAKPLRMTSVATSLDVKGTNVYGGGPDEQADAIARQIRNMPVAQRETKAREYTRLRLKAINADLAARVKRGDGILDLQERTRSLASDEIAQPILATEKVTPAYDRVVDAVSNAARDYRSGATTEDLKRTAQDLSRAADSSVIEAVRAQRRIGAQETNEIVMNMIGSDLVVLEIIIRSLVTEDVNEAITACVQRI